MDIESARTGAFGIGTVGQGIFVLVYSFRRKWWLHQLGRMLFTMAWALWLALFLGWVYRIHPMAHESGVKAVAFWILAGAVCWQAVLLIKQDQEDTARPKPYVDPEMPESWYWIECRGSGYWKALEPPPDHAWLLVRNDLELEWFKSAESAASKMERMIEMDLSVVAAAKRQGKAIK